MKFAVLFLAALATAAPPSVDDDKHVVTENFFPERLAIYTSKHDIVEIVFPLNKINLCYEGFNKDGEITLFFVEADIKDNDDYDYKGLYVLKGNKTKKVLENGQCSAYAPGRKVYLGAKDGIYEYNHDDQTVTKYGHVTESVIKMAVDMINLTVYYLTEDYVFHKLTYGETESSKIDAIKDARDFAINFEVSNIYYYDGSKQFYMYNGEKVVKVPGLPEHPKKVNLFRVPFPFASAFAVIDGVLYSVRFDGTSQKIDIEFQALPTAFAPDMMIMEWFGYKKKIYEYNVTTLAADKSIDELNGFLNENKDTINRYKVMLQHITYI